MTSRASRWRGAVPAFAADAAVVVVFVALGRRSHDAAGGVSGFVEVLWPFAVALVVAWALTRLWTAPTRASRVGVAWALTIAVAMALRIGVGGRELRPSFVVVAAVFVGAGMAGWRAVRVTRTRVGSRPG